MNKSILLTYDDFRKIEFNQQLDPEGLHFDNNLSSIITVTKILSSEDSQNFKIEMPKGCKWNTHFHNCKEKIVLYEGELLNNTTNNKIDRLKPFIIDAYTDHSIEALEDSIFYIEFRNPSE